MGHEYIAGVVSPDREQGWESPRSDIQDHTRVPNRAAKPGARPRWQIWVKTPKVFVGQIARQSHRE